MIGPMSLAEPVSACNTHEWPKVQRFDDWRELAAPICDWTLAESTIVGRKTPNAW